MGFSMFPSFFDVERVAHFLFLFLHSAAQIVQQNCCSDNAQLMLFVLSQKKGTDTKLCIYLDMSFGRDIFQEQNKELSEKEECYPLHQNSILCGVVFFLFY